MSASSDRIIEVFSQAKARAAGAERERFLAEACQGDAELRKQVDSILQADAAASDFLQNTQVVLAPAVATEKLGDRIGPYKLLEKIGEGGMGTVWMAEQTEPVRRRVALKVIKQGMDSGQVLARFEAELQALALMDHPNIARIFDAGVTGSLSPIEREGRGEGAALSVAAGRPYFVMELVKGIPITKFCDEQRLSIRERLDLFIPVCQAIQHAHQKGIIHRDIKPSNVLVALYDGKPVPKVIDFGVAKAIGQQLTERTLFTGFGALVGTLEYMSPEQAELNQLDIDTRSDIYSLGVLLYELLTGTTPLTRENLRQAAFDEVLRCIRETEPPRPSTRLSESKDRLPTISAQRKLDPAHLLKLLRGDLDWIVMKCLEKDRKRRDETASGLGSDIAHHLNDEPVTAAAPSALYKLHKFARRNKVALGVAAMLVFLATSLLVSTFLLFKEFRAGKYGGITVNSNPNGAEVWHNGNKVGTTPFEVASIPLGEFTYSLVLKSYETVTNTTTLVSKRHMNDFTFLRQVEPQGTSTVPVFSTNVTELIATAPHGATILTMEGTVQVARKGSTEWLPAQTNMVLTAGERLRTRSRSRATLRLSDLSILRVDQLSELEIELPGTNKLAKPSLQLKGGTIEFFKRDTSSNSIPVSTPNARIEIRG